MRPIFPVHSLAVLALLSPALAHAECPVAADLGGGILFVGAHGEEEVFAAQGEDMVSATYRTQDGYASEALLAHGVFLIELLDLVGTEGETRTSYEFPLEISDIQTPQAGAAWDVTVSVTDGNNNVFERQLYTYGARESVTFGDCTYDVIPFTAEYSTAPEVVETYHYLPDLGLSYLYGYLDPTGEATYPYVEIKAVP